MSTDQNQPTTENGEPQSGHESRAERMRRPKAVDVAKATAEQHGVCIKPIARERLDKRTGKVDVVPVACGATRSTVCPPCAEKAKKLRMAQCREGWHLDEEPDFTPDPPSERMQELLSERAELHAVYQETRGTGRPDVLDEIAEQVAEIDRELRELGMRGSLPPLEPPENKPARKRSTRRRQDMPNLPRHKVSEHTVGAVYAGRYRPSMFLTLTLDSYGPVHSRKVRDGRVVTCGCGEMHHKDDPRLGIPLDPENYDYRRAARDAVHFPKLVDRFWQNLRRCVGWDVQYFATVEPQKRGAPHMHAAIRGAIPRETLRQVVAATYHQVWWPPHDELLYSGESVPVWSIDADAFVDPNTREPLPTWDEALDELDENDEQEPAHLVQAGPQLDVQGVLAGSNRADKAIGYLTKYLTKSVDECHEPDSAAEWDHADRLLAELEVTPCSPRCAVWLLYGIQPQGVRSSATPGHCKGKAHKPSTLGIAGRRVLVSRKWSGKSLADHRHDRREFVHAMLSHLGIRKTTDDDEPDRYQWQSLRPGDSNMPPRDALLLHAVSERMRWRAEYEQAKAAANGDLEPPGDETSAMEVAA
ncbi:hypothetical protein J2S53_003125 [Actinopolyspora lacussalsi]|nr:hypothetical protein [Actinopolyspora lacussalsi]